MGSTISFLHLNHTLKCVHGFLLAPLHPMELEIFIDLVFQDLIVVLSDVIEYHYLLYMEIYEV